ncbi:MAG: ABC transporter substrate-binding protein [Clostridiales bacterium]|nr:ABC transporter substrate-binding protein [Clostridiales bacterium]
MKRLLALLLALLMVACVFSACGKTDEPVADEPETSTAPEASSGPAVEPPVNEAPETIVEDNDRVLQLAVNTEWKPMDPNETNAIISKNVWYQVYEGLFYYDHAAGEVVPRVAESYEVSPDGLTWTFKLRDNVYFHNGDVVTVDDVVYSYERAMQGSPYKNHTAAIKSVSAPDDKTFVVELNYAYSPFQTYIPEIWILSEKFVTEHNNDLSDAMCGTGPYMPVSIDRSIAIEVTAFDKYYGEAPKIKHIKWNVLTDSAAAAMALQSGDLDFLDISWSQVPTMQADPNLNVTNIPTYHTAYMSFNCQSELYSDVRVRQALAMLIDVEEIGLVAFEGYCDSDPLVMHPGLIGMPDAEDLDAVSFKKDPEKALALLAEAGYDTSKEMHMGSIITYPENHYLFKPAQVIQAQLAEYNVIVELEPLEASAWSARYYAGEYDLGVLGGSYGTDITGYGSVHGSTSMGKSGGNGTFNYNEKIDELFTKSGQEQDLEKRKAIGLELLQELYNSCPQIGVGHKYNMAAYTKDLNAFIRLDYQIIAEWSWAA